MDKAAVVRMLHEYQSIPPGFIYTGGTPVDIATNTLIEYTDCYGSERHTTITARDMIRFAEITAYRTILENVPPRFLARNGKEAHPSGESLVECILRDGPIVTTRADALDWSDGAVVAFRIVDCIPAIIPTGWTSWTPGGAIPTGPVKVMYRDGQESTFSDAKEMNDWHQNLGYSSDIIAWKQVDALPDGFTEDLDVDPHTIVDVYHKDGDITLAVRWYDAINIAGAIGFRRVVVGGATFSLGWAAWGDRSSDKGDASRYVKVIHRDGTTTTGPLEEFMSIRGVDSMDGPRGIVAYQSCVVADELTAWPKAGDRFWYVGRSGTPYQTVWGRTPTYDAKLLALHNVYRTKSEADARAKRDEIAAISEALRQAGGGAGGWVVRCNDDGEWLAAMATHFAPNEARFLTRDAAEQARQKVCK